MAQAQPEKTNASAQRLQDIEQHIIEAVETAALVMDELSKLGPQLAKARVAQLCETFIAKIQAAQVLVLEGVENPIADRDFKATVYQVMIKAHLGHEKVSTVATQLGNMLSTCQQGLQLFQEDNPVMEE